MSRYQTLIASMLLTSFLISSSAISVSPATVGFATPQGEEQEEGSTENGSGGEQSEDDDQQQDEGSEEQQEEQSIAEDQPEDEQTQEPVLCPQHQVLNTETGQCEEVQQEEQLVPNEICNNSIDDDLDGAADSADGDCLRVQGPQDTGIVEPSRLPSNIGDIIAPGGEAPSPDGTAAPPPLEPPAGPPTTEDAGILRQSPSNIDDLINPPLGTEESGLVVEPPIPTDTVSDTSDRDEDGVPANIDNCAGYNPNQKDSDGDGEGDACDEDQHDFDGDGKTDLKDNCPFAPNADQKDSDGDGIGDACPGDPVHGDIDGDGVPNDEDNCPQVPHQDQKDCNYSYNIDQDGDGLPTGKDNCTLVYNPDQKDSDDDDIGDLCDTFVIEENLRDNIQPSEKGLCNDGIDNDQDGLTDARDIEDCSIVQQKPPIGFDPFIQ